MTVPMPQYHDHEISETAMTATTLAMPRIEPVSAASLRRPA